MDDMKRRLHIRAAENGRSMEQEARDILRSALEQEPSASRDLAPGDALATDACTMSSTRRVETPPT